MNILVPNPWLEEHLQTTATVEELQKFLSLSGPSVERIHQIQNEPVMDIEVTTNRMDMASVWGIAREAAAILPRAGFPSTLKHVPMYEASAGQIVHSTEQFPINIQNDPTLCSRVTAVILEVNQQPSPEWMQKRVEQTGTRSINNLVDVTNYVMSEIGHPTHVFDADRVSNNMIIRASEPGEKIVTLDEKAYTLAGGDVVIDNGAGTIIDLIGVMGTANSVVTEHTKRILFFIDHADAKRIRATSMGLAIRTKAAQLNEKMLDPNLVMDAMLRGIYLYQQIADAKIVSPILDIFPSQVQEKTIRYPLTKTEQYLGIFLDASEQISILEDLGCTVTQQNGQLEVKIPTYRPDLEIPVDITEEIARIYGYHNIPSTLMDTKIPTRYPLHTNFALEHDVKQFLSTLGLQEVYTYSAVSKELAEQSGYPTQYHIEIQNPLNEDHMFMRRSLVPSHTQVLENNASNGLLSVFELANIYEPREKELPQEELHLTLTSVEPIEIVKGYAEALFDRLFITNYQFVQTSEQAANIMINHVKIGSLVASNSVIAADFMWKSLLKTSNRFPHLNPLPKFSPMLEDFTFAIPETEKIGDVITSIKQTSLLIQTVALKDTYKRNFTFRVQFYDDKKQISNEDVLPIRKDIIEKLQQKHHASIIGEA